MKHPVNLLKLISQKELLLFISLLILVIAYRIFILINFGFIYTDSDQSVMWLGTADYAQGIFHEPCFYGQSYNTMLESLLAVPLYKMGIPLYMALPITTTLMTLFPFVFIAFLTFMKRSKKTGLLILIIPMLLPIEYDLITSLSRGFVTGIAVVSLSFFTLFRPYHRSSFFLFGLLMVVGFTVNSNSILLSFPCLLYLFSQNLKNKYFYIFTSIGVFLGSMFHFMIYVFYLTHPAYNIHKYKLQISANYFKEGINHLDDLFNSVTPLFWHQGYLLLVFPLVLSLLFYRRKMVYESIITSIIPFMLLLTLFLSKIYDGSNFVFFSYARMYLAVPVLLVVMISWHRVRSNVLIFLFVLLFGFSITHKVNNSHKSITKCINGNTVVSIIETKRLIAECEEINKLATGHQVGLVIINNHWFYDLYNYGCPACMKEFPKTLRPGYERRT